MCASTYQSHISSHHLRSGIEILLFYGGGRSLFERGRQFEHLSHEQILWEQVET